jgi:outer membrane protein TolC
LHRLFIAILPLLALGCSAGSYRYSADRQVQSLVRDRERRTLDYEPDVQALTSVPPTPTKAAYSKLPITPLAPPTTAPIAPAPDLPLPFGPLGPEQLLPSGSSSGADSTLMDAELTDERALQLGPSAPGHEVPRLDLFASIAYAVQHSREYQSQMEDLYLAALDVTLERHLFEPRPFATVGARYSGGQEDVAYRSAVDITNSVGVRQRLPYGGEVTAAALVTFVNAINGSVTDSEPASLAINASIPLLRGAGMVNLESLITSERELVYQVRQFEDFRRTFAVGIAAQYFNLIAEQAAIEDRKQNLQSLRLLTERTRAMYSAGRLNYIDVQRSLQEQLIAENSLSDARAEYQNSLDEFKLLLGMSVSQPVAIVQRELEVNIPQYRSEDAVQLAQQYRLDLRTSVDQIEDAQRAVSVAKNGLLPELTLTASARVANPSGAPASHIDNDTSTYSAGVLLDLPIDRLAERNIYRRSLISLERSQRSFERLRDQVSAAARDALRSIRSAQITLDIQAKGIELARLRLENANVLIRYGRRSDNRDVVDAQQALLRAQDQYQRAKADLQIQVLQFLRVTGLLRVDPDAGVLGRAMDRRSLTANESAPQTILR